MSQRALVDSMKALAPEDARPKMVHELVLCGPNVWILDRIDQLGLVWDELAVEFDLWIGDSLVPDPVEGIGRIRNQLVEKDFLLGVPRYVGA